MIKKKSGRGTKKKPLSKKTTSPRTPIKEKVTPSIVNFPIVGVGASAGGLEAVTQFLKRLSPDTGVAVVVIQHLDPKHESFSAEILGRATAMPVFEAQDGMRLQPDRVYVIPPNYYLSLSKETLKLSPRKAIVGLHLPINFFFSSLAEEVSEHAIGVVLSGTASDGTKGLLAIKAEGGVTFAQTPESAKYAGMPQSAISAGAVDFVLTPEGIADEISRISHSNYVVAQVSAPEEHNKNEASETTLNKIFGILRNRVQVDFTHYKRSTILRRLARRMLVIKSKDLESYASYLGGHPDESKALFADILIHVTEFFRDGDTLDSLKTSVLKKLIRNRDPKTPFRVWVAGCSTGEEAYSLAIMLLEYLEETSPQTSLQIFASDISENAIIKARTGLYGEIIPGVSKTRLEKYFDKVSGGYRVKKEVRHTCVFSNHDVTRDPPFAKVDLISCRNVLIYFDDELQKRVFPIFHYSLNPGGILLLGKAENIGAFAHLFSTVDKAHKVFLKKDVKTPIKSYAPSVRTTPVKATESLGPSLSHATTYIPNQSEIQKELDRIALRDYSPPSIVINDSMDILQVRGRTAPYLELAPGHASLNLLKMARPELISHLRKLIKAACTKDRPVKKEGFSILDINGIITFNIKVTPLKPSSKSGDRCYAIFFEVMPHAAKAMAIPPKTKSSNLKQRHLLELQQSKANEDRLQDLNEEYETAQEELTAANEELQSANEELQSTNEEMETAREELQSSNEELTTVNDELQTRNAEMIQLNSDIVNLVASTEIPIAMVGSDGRIRLCTPQAEKQFKIITGDVGRKLGDLKPDLGGLNLEELVNEVMTTSVAKEIETQDSTGHWFQLNVKPYRSIEKKVDGAVMSLIDIHNTKTALEVAKVAEKNLLAARADAIKIIEANPVPLLVINSKRKVVLANKAFYMKFDPNATEGHTLAELGNGQWDIPALTSVIEKTLSEGTEFHDFEIKHVFPHIGLRVMILNARRVELPGSGIETVLLAIEDYTEKRKIEEDLRASEEKYRNLVATSYDGIMVIRQDASIDFANGQIEAMFGYGKGELINKNYEILITDRDRRKHSSHHRNYLVNPQMRVMGRGLNLFGQRKDGSEFPVDISLSPFKLKSETFVNCVVRDITNLKEIEKERSQILAREKEARAVAEKSNHEKDEFLAMLSHELRTPLTSILTWSQMLRQGRLDTEKTQKAYAILEQSALAQGQLIDDLLDVSRIQAGKLNLSIQKIDPRKVIAAAIESTRSLAASKSIQIETKIDPSVLHIFADPIRLQQVLWNLLTNSIKFSNKDGKIWVTLEPKITPAGERICVQVRDNGKGIKPEFIPIIFNRFTQVDSSSTRAYGGLGLGLAILKNLVEMHHGTVEVESPGEGKGATFTIYLPVENGEKISSSETETETEAEAQAEVSLHGLRVLLVEDEQNARDAFFLMLRSFGAEVKAAESASAALAIFEEFKPNVLVSDIAMPGEDGYSLIGKIRALKSELRNIPALALTACAEQSDIQQALVAGFQSHMAKPVDANKLALAIARLAGKLK